MVAFPGLQALDLTGPHEVFEAANRVLVARGAEPAYAVRVAAVTPGPIRSESGLRLLVDHRLDEQTCDTVVVPGGDGVSKAAEDDALRGWLAAAPARARRVASVCTGAFVLAAAGLLDGRTVTTHWARAERLAADYPAVRVDADALHRRDGAIWTSAGVTAGIDLALALVEDDLGPDVAQTVARWFVMFLRRPGGQSQFAAPVWTEAPRSSPVRAACALIHTAPGDDLRLDTLARRVGLSSRQLSRAFTAEIGVPPGRYVERVRVEHARRLLERNDQTVAAVACAVGYGSAETLRRAFLRQVGVAPDAWRHRFALSPATPKESPCASPSSCSPA